MWRKNNDTLYLTDKTKAPESAKLRFYYANEITQSVRIDIYRKGSPERLNIIEITHYPFSERPWKFIRIRVSRTEVR
jgi:hypothetical protein